MKIKDKILTDRLVNAADSPILDEEIAMFDGKTEGMAVSGKLSIGKNGNPVTIYVEDEETGEVLEMSHVRQALLVIEDQRQSTSGWLSVAIGNVEKISGVLEFLARTTLEGLKKLTGKP
jgi:hypothetical protein